jgi:hypothetical protein
MAPKIYLKCSAKQKQTPYGQILILGVKAQELAEFARQHQNERGYINLVITERKEPSQYGDTHSVYLDTYVKSSGNDAPVTTTRQAVGDDFDHSDVPF